MVLNENERNANVDSISAMKKMRLRVMRLMTGSTANPYGSKNKQEDEIFFRVGGTGSIVKEVGKPLRSHPSPE